MSLNPQQITDPACHARPDYADYTIGKIAVLDFTDAETKPTSQFIPHEKFGLRAYDNHVYLQSSGNDARSAAERSLLQSYRYQVIERRNLDAILNEQGLSLTGIIDTSSAREVGKLTGADAVLLGDVQEAYALFTKNTKGDGSFIGTYLAYVSVDTRLVDVESGDILLACGTRRNSLNYLDKPLHITNHDLIRDVHMLERALRGATPKERVRYILDQAVKESLAGILK